ncbi:hypothetical protein ACFP1L_09495 [Lactiplantibacillus nangangensis]|uniref:Uncharacterized protein n=1 Tax=Lactiplantibacillus nangangensis TaxID=2559917 RepID=A0ABW1SK42_9LACO|nr:hypothetical protein [Lactiplantibacillus nangangensis]
MKKIKNIILSAVASVTLLSVTVITPEADNATELKQDVVKSNKTDVKKLHQFNSNDLGRNSFHNTPLAYQKVMSVFQMIKLKMVLQRSLKCQKL